jgi:branched-chain amino acid transport system permease protein
MVSLAGSLFAQFMLYIDPMQLMTLNISMMIVLVAVMGGVGTVIGPIIGAGVLTLISETTRVYLGKYGGLDMILYGVLVILIVLFLPKGLISLKEQFMEGWKRVRDAEKGAQ